MPKTKDVPFTFSERGFNVLIDAEIVRMCKTRPLNPTISPDLSLSFMHRELDEWLQEHLPDGLSPKSLQTLSKERQDVFKIKLGRLLAFGHGQHPEVSPHPDAYEDLKSPAE